MTFPSCPRVPPSVLLVTGVPAMAAVCGAALAAWLVSLSGGGLLWWAAVPAMAGTWWGAAHGTSWLAVEVARDVRAVIRGHRERRH